MTRRPPRPTTGAASSPHRSAMCAVSKRKVSACQQNGNSHGGGKKMRYSGPDLPEEIWCLIHSLLTLQDAARAACVSRTFLCSWRCRPSLFFSNKTLGLNETACPKEFIDKVDHILKKHSGIGVKTFGFHFHPPVDHYLNRHLDSHHDKHLDSHLDRHLDRWLQLAIKTGVEELIIDTTVQHNFPCPRLFDWSGNTIQYLYLSNCVFRPTVKFGCLRRLYLFLVSITGDELECLLFNSSALQQLTVRGCFEIVCLKIPSMLQHLSYLKVSGCRQLKLIECKAPNLFNFYFGSFARVSPSFGDYLHVKNMEMELIPCTIHYACTKLPSIVPNLNALTIKSAGEQVNAPAVPVKFLCLKFLSIHLDDRRRPVTPAYDYFSLVSFLDACPVLETFIMKVTPTCTNHDSDVGDPSHLRQISKCRHGNLKNVMIFGFSSAKSMLELACHIIQNTTSLEYLTLDTLWGPVIGTGAFTCSVDKTGKCSFRDRHEIMEARKAVLTIRNHIVGKIPSTVRLNVIEPCTRCHVLVD